MIFRITNRSLVGREFRKPEPRAPLSQVMNEERARTCDACDLLNPRSMTGPKCCHPDLGRICNPRRVRPWARLHKCPDGFW